MSLFDETLAHVHASELGQRCVLRGSLLTSMWIPGRVAKDIDVLVDGAWTPDTLKPQVAETFRTLPNTSVEIVVIWEETDFPGLRATVTREAETVQVDFGWGEQLAVPPRPTEVRGRTWRAVGPEVMVGWKVHSLVEHGPRGRWHAKTIADAVLLFRHVKLDEALTVRAIRCAFDSQRLPLSQLDGFFNDPTWGLGRGSRNKWKSYLKKSPWVTFTLVEAMTELRTRVRPLVEQAAALPMG